MKAEGGKTNSIWALTTDVPLEPELTEDREVNVCVVGAGIAGLTTAYLLAQEGKSVIVLDDGPAGGGETGRTTAHLSPALDEGYVEIERLHGLKGANLAAKSHSTAIDRIEEIVREENIPCGFVRVNGYLFNAPGTGRDNLDKELEAARRAGIQVQVLDRVPHLAMDTSTCLRFPNQAQFQPLRYLSALMSAIKRLGGEIFTRMHVEEVTDGDPVIVRMTGGRQVKAHAAVVATNTPINDRFAVHTKQSAYRTYVIGALVPKASVHQALYWDTLDPYHYVRLTALSDQHDVLIVGGEDHKTGQAQDTEARFELLEGWAREVFPQIERVEYSWSGQVMEPIDGLAFIGRNPGDEHVYIVTGDSGHGMTHGTIAGMLIPDLIQGRENDWTSLYDPSRKNLRAAGEFAKENINVVAQYVDLVTGGTAKDEEEIASGHGAVVRRGLQKLAVYRDERGELHELSAVCPHIGCIVDWNPTEHTWDCPCHGSRFTPDGKVLNGPAISGLTPVTDDSVQPVMPIPIANA